jgi:WD40 repeat protein
MVFSVAFPPDWKTVVRGSADKLVQIWDVEAGAEMSATAQQSAWDATAARCAFRMRRSFHFETKTSVHLCLGTSKRAATV